MSNLEFLDIHSNKIDSVPESICNLTKLQALNISYTDLKSLPKNIDSLSELIRLDLFGCRLTSLPSELKNLKKLRYLNVYDNFGLKEDYKKWFDAKIYTCKDDPEEDTAWVEKWYYNE